MISIRKFLSADNDTERTPLEVVRLLVNGISWHTVEGDSADYARFRKRMGNISVALLDELSPADLLAQAGSVVEALEEYNLSTSQHLRLQTAELQNMVRMLTSTVGAVSSASNDNVSRLSEIEAQLAFVSELDDVRIIKTKLSDCLTDIRMEAERQRRETGETIEKLTQGLEQAQKRPASGFETSTQDVVTGLPLRPEAEMALVHAGRGGSQAFAVVLVLDRMQALNARFGRDAGDKVLVDFAHMVRKHLTPGDRLFRWSGPALLALLPRPCSIDRVRVEVSRIMETKLEHTIQTPSRSILLAITARWTVFPMMAAPRLIYQKIDAFASVPAPHD